MNVPTFKERTIPIYYIETYINEEASEEAKQFNRIRESIKEFESLPTVEEMTAILEYEENALDYCYKLAINTLDKRGFDKEFVDIYNAVNDSGFYKTALNNDIIYIKYCTLQKVLGELKIIDSIKQDVRQLNFNFNNYERQVLQTLQDLTTEWNSKNISFTLKI